MTTYEPLGILVYLCEPSSVYQTGKSLDCLSRVSTKPASEQQPTSLDEPFQLRVSSRLLLPQ
jgi:hypothetical protein